MCLHDLNLICVRKPCTTKKLLFHFPPDPHFPCAAKNFIFTFYVLGCCARQKQTNKKQNKKQTNPKPGLFHLSNARQKAFFCLFCLVFSFFYLLCIRMLCTDKNQTKTKQHSCSRLTCLAAVYDS